MGRGQKWLDGIGKGWNALIGGWRLSGITRMMSGAPFTVRSESPLRDYGQSIRPNRVGSGLVEEEPGVRGVDYPWFNASDFEAVPCVDLPWCTESQYGFEPFDVGNSGRNILDLPGFTTLDVSMSKDFAPTERVRIGLRVEAFNALNLKNLNGLDTRLNRGDVGYLSGGTTGPRTLQLGLRLSF